MVPLLLKFDLTRTQTVVGLSLGCNVGQDLIKNFTILAFIYSMYLAYLVVLEEYNLSSWPIFMSHRLLSISLELFLNLSHCLNLSCCPRFAFWYQMLYSRSVFFSKVEMPSNGLSQIVWPCSLSPKGQTCKD